MLNGMMSDWGGLRTITDEAKVIAKAERNRPLLACPVCGEPLVRNSAGVASCPLGHFRTTARTHGELGGVA